MSDIQKIIVPDVGGDEVEVIELCVAVGDNIEADEGVVTVESDKASMDIPAPFEGEIVSLSVSVGDKIKEGDVMKMRQVDHITLAAKETTELKPGSLHIMLFDLKKPLNEGDEIEVTVTYDNGQKQSFTAPVKKVMAGMKKHEHHH